MSKCPSCGSELRFDPEKQLLVCDSCKNEYDPVDFNEESLMGEKYDVHSYVCPQCGGELYTVDDTAVTFCSYCGSSVALEEQFTEVSRPKLIIPFKISREEAEASYRSMVRRSIFTPGNMSKDEQIEKFRGIYMPYWVYRFEKKGETAVYTSKSRRRGDYIYTTSYRIDSTIDYMNKGIAFDSSKAYADNLSQAAAPYDIHEAVEFDPDYLAGFYADAGSVAQSTYDNDALEIVKEDLADRMADSSKLYDRYNASGDQLKKASKPKLSDAIPALYPVWFLATRNRKGDRISYAVINGQSGKAVAELPISFGKYLLGSLLLSLPIFAVLNMHFVITPSRMLNIAIVLSLLGLVMINSQLNRIYTRENDLDDAGKRGFTYRYRPEKPDMTDPSSVFWTIISGIVGFMVAVAIMIGLMAVLIYMDDHIYIGENTLVAMALLVIIAPIYMGLNISRWISNRRRGIKTSDYSYTFMQKLRYLYKPIIAGIVSCAVRFIAPAYDIYYYAAASLSILMIVLSFRDLVNGYNKLISRRLPQFEIRGGDRNA